MSRERPDFVGVYGWLEDGDAVLLVATDRDLGQAGRRQCWELPGGKIEPGETPEAALAREMREETGLEVEVGPELFRFRGERVTGGRRRYGWLARFFALRRVGGVLGPREADTVDARFHPVADLPAVLTSPYHAPVLKWLRAGRPSGEGREAEPFVWEDA
ncbi:MAG TPA: NUDIX hydrolase [Planctomycetota bacterium]|nr:NUDIX hydrolase [Planctomycetota bacterium]